MRKFVWMSGLWGMAAGCGPAESIPIGGAPDDAARPAADADGPGPGAADEGVVDESGDAGRREDAARPVADARRSEDAMGTRPDAGADPRRDASVAGAPWAPSPLVRGPAADALRASADGVVLDTRAETDVFSFLADAPDAPLVRVSPADLGGWASGPQPVNLGDVASDTGVAFLRRGGGLTDGPLAGEPGVPSVLSAGLPGDEVPSLPINDLFAVRLDGRDAEAPRFLAQNVQLFGPRACADVAGACFLTTPVGLSVVASEADVPARPVQPNPPGMMLTVLGVSNTSRRMYFTEVPEGASRTWAAALWSVPMATPEVAPTLVYRLPDSGAPAWTGSGAGGAMLDDRWGFVRGAAGRLVVFDTTGVTEPRLLLENGTAVTGLRTAGDRVLFAAPAVVDGYYGWRWSVVDLAALPLAPPRRLVEDVLHHNLDLAIDAAAERLAFAVADAVWLVPLEDGAPRRLPLSAGRLAAGPLAFSPDGEALLVATRGVGGRGVDRVPVGDAPTTTLIPPDDTVTAITLGTITARGHFFVARDAGGGATLSQYGLDGAERRRIALPGPPAGDPCRLRGPRGRDPRRRTVLRTHPRRR
jgi:hypothetical protein